MTKQLLTRLRLIVRMNFSWKNYSCELFNLTRTDGEAELISTFKPGLHISRKDRKHRLENMFLSFPAMAWSLHGSNDHRH